MSSQDIHRHDDRSSDEEKQLDTERVDVANYTVADEKYHFDASDLDGVQRKLKQRHVQMYVPLADFSF